MHGQRFLRSLPSLLVLAALAGCSGGGSHDGAEDVKVDFTLQPRPLRVGPATATIQLTDKGGQPLRGAALKLEGNMNHAGMKPVFADVKEVGPGKYEGTLELSMGGDWFVLIDGTLADGRKLKRKVDVPGVKAE